MPIAHRVWVSKYLCGYDDPHWGLRDVLVILRIKVGSIPENIGGKRNIALEHLQGDF